MRVFQGKFSFNSRSTIDSFSKFTFIMSFRSTNLNCSELSIINWCFYFKNSLSNTLLLFDGMPLFKIDLHQIALRIIRHYNNFPRFSTLNSQKKIKYCDYTHSSGRQYEIIPSSTVFPKLSYLRTRVSRFFLLVRSISVSFICIVNYSKICLTEFTSAQFSDLLIICVLLFDNVCIKIYIKKPFK